LERFQAAPSADQNQDALFPYQALAAGAHPGVGRHRHPRGVGPRDAGSDWLRRAVPT